MVSSGILASLLVPLSPPPHTPSPSPLLSPTHPLLSAQWKSLITGGESNPWQWMKDEGLPPSLSFSQSLSLSSFFPWMLVMLGRFSPSLPLIFPLPLSPSLSLFSLFLFFLLLYFPLFFPPSTFFLSVQVKVSRRNPPLLRLDAERKRSEFTGKVWGDKVICFMAEDLLIELITKLQPISLA